MSAFISPDLLVQFSPLELPVSPEQAKKISAAAEVLGKAGLLKDSAIEIRNPEAQQLETVLDFNDVHVASAFLGAVEGLQPVPVLRVTSIPGVLAVQ